MSLAIGIVGRRRNHGAGKYRAPFFNMGKTARQAALDGAREITFAATAANDLGHRRLHPRAAGQWVRRGFFSSNFGMTISTAVGLSLLEAITLTPMRCSQFMTAKEGRIAFSPLFCEPGLHRFCERPIVAPPRPQPGTIAGKSFRFALALFALSLTSVPWLKKEFFADAGYRSFCHPVPDACRLLLGLHQQQGRRAGKDSPRRAFRRALLREYRRALEAVKPTKASPSFRSRTATSERKASNRSWILCAMKSRKRIPKDFDAFIINPSGNFGGAKRGTSIELSIRGQRLCGPERKRRRS